MTRTSTREKLNLSYERSTVTEDDVERDPTPSVFPMRVVIPADGETVDECTVPLEEVAMVPLRKCAAVIPFSKTLRRVG